MKLIDRYKDLKYESLLINFCLGQLIYSFESVKVYKDLVNILYYKFHLNFSGLFHHHFKCALKNKNIQKEYIMFFKEDNFIDHCYVVGANNQYVYYEESGIAGIYKFDEKDIANIRRLPSAINQQKRERF